MRNRCVLSWFLENPILYISNDKRTYPDVVRMWRQFHGYPGSGGGIEGVFTSVGKHHDDLKKWTMDKTLENTLKTGRQGAGEVSVIWAD